MPRKYPSTPPFSLHHEWDPPAFAEYSYYYGLLQTPLVINNCVLGEGSGCGPLGENSCMELFTGYRFCLMWLSGGRVAERPGNIIFIFRTQSIASG